MKLFYSCLLLLGLTAVLIACGSDDPPQAVTVGEVCSLPAKTLVEVEGNLNLSTILTCQEGKCGINLGKDGSGVSARVRGRENLSENSFQLPPDQYTLDDLTVMLDDGTTLQGRNLPVLARGRVSSYGGGCVLDVHSLHAQ